MFDFIGVLRASTLSALVVAVVVVVVVMVVVGRQKNRELFKGILSSFLPVTFLPLLSNGLFFYPRII